jgi:hypothetical protein
MKKYLYYAKIDKAILFLRGKRKIETAIAA